MKIDEISNCSKSSFFSFSIRRITVQLSSRFGHVSNFHQIFTIVETFAHVFATTGTANTPGFLNRGYFTRYLGASARQPKSFVASSVAAVDLRRYQDNQLDPGRIVVGPVINKCPVLKVNFSIRFTCPFHPRFTTLICEHESRCKVFRSRSSSVIMQYLFDFYFQLTFNTKIFPYL